MTSQRTTDLIILNKFSANAHKLPAKYRFQICHTGILKTNGMTEFCQLFIEQPLYVVVISSSEMVESSHKK